MTSINFHFRASLKRGVDQGKLFIRLIHNRKVKNLTTDYRLYPWEWDPQSGILLSAAASSDRRRYLSQISDRMDHTVLLLRQCVDYLEAHGEYSVDDVVLRYNDGSGGNTLGLYCDQVSGMLRDNGQVRTARAYVSSVRSLIRFNRGRDPQLDDIRSDFIQRYERYLQDKGLHMNTISFYMRNLRALYYRALRDNLLVPRPLNPFSGVFTGIYETRKRALSDRELNDLASLEHTLSQRITVLKPAEGKSVSPRTASYHQALQESLMYFMFCFHARGMSFVDMAYLRKSDITDGVIRYRRKKTGGYLEVKVTRPMDRILAYFASGSVDSKYLFPLIDPSRGDERRQYENGLRFQNLRLKELARLAGIDKCLSTHVSRHTWATLAKWSKVEISLISEALGHRSVEVTYKYLASFERSALDRLSDKISKVVGKVS